MYVFQLARSTLLALLVERAVATPDSLAPLEVDSLEKRLVCNLDNVLRALQSNSAAASPFCLTFGDISIPTKTIPVPGVTPTVITTSSYLGRTYFPDGRFVESIAVPSYVSQYSATRVSSGCSCLLTSSTSTVTAAPTMTTTITTTVSGTLTGACGTRKTFAGGYTVRTADPVQSIVRFDYDSNAVSCCDNCNIQLKGGACVAWAVVPGKSCALIYSPFIYRGPSCPYGLLNGTVVVNLAKYPDAIAGVGPCAATVTAVPG